MTKKLLKQLDYMLKHYIPESDKRQSLMKELVEQFQGKPIIRYTLSESISIYLIRDGKQLNRLRRYIDSPFPLLSNVEFFVCSVGEWDSELKSYGIQTREKSYLESKPEEVGTQIYLVRRDTVISRGNQYLLRQYRRLEIYRNHQDHLLYWSLVWKLMCHSMIFRIACLNSWLPRWYKELPITELNKIWRNLHRILNLETLTTPIYNVWVESPKDKWRQLGVPPKAWRLYLHMLNKFISYLYSPRLDPKIYDGFLYNRGTKSWWESLIWGRILTAYSWILEIDLSSGFPNLSLKSVRSALQQEGLIPPNIINLLITHLQSPLVESTHFPTFETYVENQENRVWRQSDRSVHMGLGISPILFVITVKWAFEQLKCLKLIPGSFFYKGYADDFSFYFNTSWLYTFYRESEESLITFLTYIWKGQNPILISLNNHWLLKEVGIKLCLKKSGWVRILGIWLKSYKSLGLCLYTNLSKWSQIKHILTNRALPMNLRASTRGRGDNPKTGRIGTIGSSTVLDYAHTSNGSRLNLESLILRYRPYFGLLLSKLYTPKPKPESLKPRTKIAPQSLLGLLYKTKVNKSLIKSERLNLYNSGSKLSRLIINLNNRGHNPILEINPSLKQELNMSWPKIEKDILTTNIEEPKFKNSLDNSNQSDYFSKYSELIISPEKLLQYKKEYFELTNKRAE